MSQILDERGQPIHELERRLDNFDKILLDPHHPHHDGIEERRNAFIEQVRQTHGRAVVQQILTGPNRRYHQIRVFHLKVLDRPVWAVFPHTSTSTATAEIFNKSIFVGNFVQETEREVRKYKGVGPKSLRALKAMLKEKGLRFGMTQRDERIAYFMQNRTNKK